MPITADIPAPATSSIHTRMGSDVTIMGRGSKPGWLKCFRHGDRSVREFHELDLRADGGIAELRAAVAKAELSPLLQPPPAPRPAPITRFIERAEFVERGMRVGSREAPRSVGIVQVA